MANAGTELNANQSGRTSSYSSIGGGSVSQSRLRNSNTTHRLSNSGRSRTSTSRRTPRTYRLNQYDEASPNTTSSSSSNNSLARRYRTISGTTSQSPAGDRTPSETHLPCLLRFASLRLDTATDADTPINQPVPLAVAEVSSDLDEFPTLATRSAAEQNTLSCLPSTSTHQSVSRDRSASDAVPTSTAEDVDSETLEVSNSQSSSANSFSTVTSNSENTNWRNPQNQDDDRQTGVSTPVNPASEVAPSAPSNNPVYFTVRFPMRFNLNQGDNPNSGQSVNTNQEPEADHDFYRSDCAPPTPHRCNDHFQKILAGLNELRRCGQFCDVVLQAGSTKIPAHRNVLASSSQYFYAMFTGPMAEARSPCVQIQGIDPETLTLLIDFVYTGEIMVSEETVQALLPAANLLQMTNVRDACCEFLKSQLHPSNCLGIQRFAYLHDCPDLLASSRRFTEQHFGELLEQDDEFLALTADQLGQLISSDRLAVSEDQVFEAVLRWVAHDVENRQPSARGLCGRVRFALLPRDYLVRLSQSEEFLNANPWCKDYLIEALSYHLLSWDQKLRVTSERARPRTPIGLPKVLIVIGGQAPKAIRSVEYHEFRNGLWRSSSPDTNGSQSSVTAVAHSTSNTPPPPASAPLGPSPSSLLPIVSSPQTTIADLPSRRCRCGVAVVGGLVYVVGGFNGALRVRSVEIYDPLRNTWHSGPNMECRRATLGVAVLNGHIYAIGGFDGSTGLNSAEVFDLWSGSWRLIAPMSCRRSSVGAATLDGKIYAVGGYDGAARRCLSSVECYDPVTNSWSPVADLTCRRSGPAVCELNNRLYAVGGHDGPSVRNSAEVYSPETENWQRIADLNIQRRNAGLVAHDGCLYVVGGEDGETNLASVEKYDPATNTWVLLPGQMKIGRSYAGVAVIERNVL
ncbi:unnamed protein product [Calicophoron daubneyi]|uniref:BTB domain-containing protein n=1 Tax=Calicophoron daubneyi TaxID=300641 RepID=A0AAV2TA00_CALDB